MSVAQRFKQVCLSTPYPFQIEGVEFIEKNKGRCLIADDMGLGKSMQSSGWAAIHPGIRPLIIVCPATLKQNWRKELHKHYGMGCTILSGTTVTPMKRRRVIIINYEILKYWLPTILKMKPKMVIMDECHYIKTKGADRTKQCKALSRACKYVLPMSGTPIKSRPVEFFPVLNMLDPVEFADFWDYTQRYCSPKIYMGKWIYPGATRLGELHNRIKHLMLRRMKKDVLKHLPKKQRDIIPIQISNKKEYAAAKNDFVRWLRKTKGNVSARRAMRAEKIVRLGALKRLVAQGKVKGGIEWIKNWLDSTDEKLLVFAIHKSIIAQLKKAFKGCAIIDGSVTLKKRDQAEDKFQNDPKCRLLIGNLDACGQGLNLHASSTVLFLEMGWSPGEHDQAEDRVLRIGQTADKMNSYFMVGYKTIDIDIFNMIENKRKVLARVMDGKTVSAKKAEIIIMNKLFNKLQREAA